MRTSFWIGVLASTLLGGCTCSNFTVGNVEPPDATPQDCLIGAAGGVCEDQGCRLEVPPGALDVTRLLSVAQHDPSEDIAIDTVAGRMCLVGPEGISFDAPAELTIALEESEIPAGFSAASLVAFAYDGVATDLAEDSYSYSAPAFGVSVQGAADIGITAYPNGPRPGIELGVEVFDIEDSESYIRNLSSKNFTGAFHDGTRFYLTNGGRILIWNDGVPSDPTEPPDVVLGKPDLVTSFADPSASNMTKASQVWSDGNKMVVTGANRVLIWNQVPTQSFTPADIVLGQNSFTSTAVNGGGGPSATSLFAPEAIASDGQTLLISDALNNRVLVWDTFPVLNNQPASYVLGQQDMQSNAIRGGAIPMQQPRGVYWDGQRVVLSSVFTCTCADVLNGFPDRDNEAADTTIGVPGIARVGTTAFSLPGAMSQFGSSGFALRDHRGVRVSVWRDFPEEPSAEPDFFLGKPDGLLGGTSLGGVSSASFSSKVTSNGIFANDSLVVVPDGRRVMIWESLPTVSFAPADLIIGQPTATTAGERIDYRGIGRTTLAHPSGVASGGGTLAIADRSNNRVIVADSDSLDPASTVVIGQPAAQSYAPNSDWRSPSAATLSEPEGVFTDGTRLVVADSGNHRVLIWNQLPTSDGAPADIVVGQVDMQASSPNAGAADLDADGDSDASAASLHRPSAVWIENSVLYVADTANHRVMVYDPIPTTNGAEASRVVGQPDMQSNEPNGGASWFAPSATGLAFPQGLHVLPSGELLVADTENNRVVGYELPVATNAAATMVLGQPDLISNTDPNYLTSAAQPGIERSDSVLQANAATLRRPIGFAELDGALYISDTGNHRVVAHSLPFENGAAATLVLGQTNFEGRLANTNGIGAHSLSAPRGLAVSNGVLFVADSANHRLLGYSDAPAVEGAAFVHGQVDMLGNGINGSSDATGVLDQPSGTAWDGTTLWVADRANHRVLGFTETASNADLPTIVLGQSELGRDLPNAGATASAGTLLEPGDVASDGETLVVADRGNNRVLIWNTLPSEIGQPADLVLGQESFESTSPNRGNGVLNPSASSMFAPDGVFLSGGTLYVADTGNNRVLVFDALPKESGVAADRVLCQQDAVSNLGNRGSTPEADTCAGPRGVLEYDGQLFVADTLNNRVLVFDADSDTGADAELVLGQPAFTTRSPVASNGSPDAVTMSGPTGLTYDGFNLAIADGGNNRVLLYVGVPTTSGAAADRVLGQSSFTTNITGPDYTSLDQPTSVTLVRGPFHSTRVVIADSGKDRLMFFDGLLHRDE